MNYLERVTRERRLVVLRTLAREHDGRMNESGLQRELDLFGHRLDREQVRELLRWLESAGALIVKYPSEVIMVAEITQRGQNHVERRGNPIEGIDTPSRS